jgi:hypothetical protein
MSSGVAALIGAGVASVVSLAAQFLSHRLATTRDRRNQRRERLHEVISEAGMALFVSSRREPATEEELARIRPDSVVAGDPVAFIEDLPPAEAIAKAITLLQVHLGSEHPSLMDSYVEVATVSLNTERAKARYLRSEGEDREEGFPALLDRLRDTQEARNRWLTHARQEVDRM